MFVSSYMSRNTLLIEPSQGFAQRIIWPLLTNEKRLELLSFDNRDIGSSFSLSWSKTSNQKIISSYFHNTVLWPHILYSRKKTLPYQPSDILISTKVRSSYAHNRRIYLVSLTDKVLQYFHSFSNQDFLFFVTTTQGVHRRWRSRNSTIISRRWISENRKKLW